jgi:hypothetical protein
MVVCVSFMDTSSVAQMRFVVRRLRRKLPAAQILLGAWLAEVDLGELAKSVKADGAAATLRSAAKFCLAAASTKPAEEPATARTPAGEPVAAAAS